MTDKRDDLGALFSLDGAPGPARRIPSAKAAALVSAALAGANFADGTAGNAQGFEGEDDAPTRVELRAAGAPAPRPRGPRRVLLVAAALVFVIGGTAAGAYVWVERVAPPPVPLVPRHAVT